MPGTPASRWPSAGHRPTCLVVAVVSVVVMVVVVAATIVAVVALVHVLNAAVIVGEID